MRQLINILVYLHCYSGIFVQVTTKRMRFLFPWPELCPSNFFAKQLKLYRMEIKHFDEHGKIRTQIVPTYFWVIAINNGRHCFATFFTHAKFWHQHKNKLRNFDCNFILTSALTFLFLWQWGQYARVLPHFIYQHCPCCSSRDYILIN